MTHRRGRPRLDSHAMHGLGQAMDTMDFMKRAWAHFKVPTTFTPTMDVEELDERIADLRTVEQWLTMNLGLLRNTIQAMELQRATLAALQKMASNFEVAMRAPAAGTPDAAAATSWPASRAGASPAQEPEAAPDDDAEPPSEEASASARPRSLFPGSPFSLVGAFPFLTPSGTGVSAKDAADEGHDATTGPDAEDDDASAHVGFGAARTHRAGQDGDDGDSDPVQAGLADDPVGQGGDPAESAADTTAQASRADGSASGPDPLAWWRLLQSSFEQIAAAATATAQPITSPFGVTRSDDDAGAATGPAGTSSAKAKKGRSGPTAAAGSKGTRGSKASQGTKGAKAATDGKGGKGARAASGTKASGESKAARAGTSSVKAASTDRSSAGGAAAKSSAKRPGSLRREVGAVDEGSGAPPSRTTGRRSGR